MLNGYALVKKPRHPKAMRGGWYWQHILIVEEHIGRYLKEYESVHHINEIKTDNRIENLFVCHRDEHDKAHGMKTVSLYRMNPNWVGKQCEACGKTFYGSPSVMKKRKRCNSLCKTKNTIDKVCSFCYNIYTVPASAGKNYRFCSKACRIRSKST